MKGRIEQSEHRLPMIWIDALLTWSWHCPVIMKQLGSTGPSTFAESLKPRRTSGRSESPKQPRLGDEWMNNGGRMGGREGGRERVAE